MTTEQHSQSHTRRTGHAEPRAQHLSQRQNQSRHTDTHTHTNRQAHIITQAHTHIEIHRQHIQGHTKTCAQMHTVADWQTQRHSDANTDSHPDTPTKHTNRHTHTETRTHTHTHTHRQADEQTDRRRLSHARLVQGMPANTNPHTHTRTHGRTHILAHSQTQRQTLTQTHHLRPSPKDVTSLEAYSSDPLKNAGWPQRPVLPQGCSNCLFLIQADPLDSGLG